MLDSPEHAATPVPLLSPYGGRIAMQGVVGWYGAVDRYLALLATTNPATVNAPPACTPAPPSGTRPRAKPTA